MSFSFPLLLVAWVVLECSCSTRVSLEVLPTSIKEPLPLVALVVGARRFAFPLAATDHGRADDVGCDNTDAHHYCCCSSHITAEHCCRLGRRGNCRRCDRRCRCTDSRRCACHVCVQASAASNKWRTNDVCDDANADGGQRHHVRRRGRCARNADRCTGAFWRYLFVDDAPCSRAVRICPFATVGLAWTRQTAISDDFDSFILVVCFMCVRCACSGPVGWPHHHDACPQAHDAQCGFCANNAALIVDCHNDVCHYHGHAHA